MRHDKMIAIMTAAVLLGTTGCGSAEVGKETEPEKETVTITEVNSSEILEDKTDNEEEKVLVEDTLTEEYANAYADALKKIYEDQILPDGSELFGGSEDITENHFAVADVNEDGVQELIVVWETGAMAGRCEFVYRYNSEKKSLESLLVEFPGVEFYTGGLATDGFSHNQGVGEMWPYNIYEYDSIEGIYKYTGCVDSWNKEICDTGFPADIDKENAGVVYQISYGNEYSEEYYSQSDYNAFYEKLISQKEKIEIKYFNLRFDFIQKLRERKLNPVITGKTVYPNLTLVDVENPADGIYPVNINPSYIYDNGDGTYMAYADIYQMETYDIVDMNTLEAGDGIECNGLLVKVESIENENGRIYINGGLDFGGLEFRAVDEDNCYVFCGLDDIATYHKYGLVVFKISDDCVITDYSDLEKQDGIGIKVDELQDYIYSNNINMNVYNTTIRVEKGEAVELTIRYMP